MKEIIVTLMIGLLLVAPVSAAAYGKMANPNPTVWLDYNTSYTMTNPYYSWNNTQKHAHCAELLPGSTCYGAAFPTINVWSNTGVFNETNDGQWWPNQTPTNVMNPASASSYDNPSSIAMNTSTSSGITLHWTVSKGGNTYSYYETVWARRYTGANLTGTIDFTATQTTGNSPLLVTFTDTSDHTSSWRRWAFGDGTSTNTTDASTIKNYLYPGVYTVRLDTYSPVYGYSNLTKTDYITANAGFVRTFAQCLDTGNVRVYHCDISIHDTTSGVFSNVTDDLDGAHYIDAAVGDLLDITAGATGYITTNRSGLTSNGGVYDMVMVANDEVCMTPGDCAGYGYDPGAGNVNFVVTVYDTSNDDPVTEATVSLIETGGGVTTGTTNEAGVVWFIPTNQTFFRVKAKADGYTSASSTITTSSFGPDSIRLGLTKTYLTATPTVTITDANGNVVETLDTRSAIEKDNAMMDKLRDAGPQILDLAIAAIMIGLLGLIFVSVKKFM